MGRTAMQPPPPRWSVRTRGGSRMRESCTYGSVRGAGSNRRPYRDRSETPQQPLSTARPWRGFRCAQPILLSLLQDIPPRPYLAVQPVRFAQDRPGLNDGPVRHVIEELQDVGEVPRCAKLRSDLGCERFSADVAIGAQRHVLPRHLAGERIGNRFVLAQIRAFRNRGVDAPLGRQRRKRPLPDLELDAW